MTAAIVGIAGPAVTPAEAAMLRQHQPVGAILFARNIETPPQLRALTAALRRLLPADGSILVDQEGGRVARLRPPHWGRHPPAAELGGLFARSAPAGLRAAWITGALIGRDCAAAGFDLVAAPVLDVGTAAAHEVIGDRAFAAEPGIVARLGRAVAQGLLAAGIQPIAKHAPGHGRAMVDSHLALPRVHANDLSRDFLPFALNADLPWAMTAHILYTTLDDALAATLSATIIGRVVRQQIGFKGVLVTDDLAMRALSGSPAERALAALQAGCDVALYCSGDFEATAALLRVCPAVTETAAIRLRAGRAMAARHRIALAAGALTAERDRLLA